MSKKVTLNEVEEAFKKTKDLIDRLKMQNDRLVWRTPSAKGQDRITTSGLEDNLVRPVPRKRGHPPPNPGMPEEFAPKGRPTFKPRSRSRPRSRSTSRPRTRSRSTSRTRPRSRSTSRPRPISRSRSRPRSRPRSRSRSRPRSRSRSRSRPRPRSRSRSQSIRNRLGELGIDKSILDIADRDEMKNFLEELDRNPNLIQSINNPPPDDFNPLHQVPPAEVGRFDIPPPALAMAEGDAKVALSRMGPGHPGQPGQPSRGPHERKVPTQARFG